MMENAKLQRWEHNRKGKYAVAALIPIKILIAENAWKA
jgi:hypothetical protein